ncbi:glycerol-3-phosphate dehydrogenase/oxidase [Natronoglycomyces albus]|uniref:Glycerol-3-phosphate dehydrogenase n=1 Tax=Natronoglycomyces albus TaxID=2811108 RepID=A0A895XVH8_9ACTN|nr:glycerol-3-phosphate dehydrogenase/oxidase [Natronoglycomyces albus]QSB05648.1 glycerol-3-phosphate dehydrogenase/oxidase [Natronoglycomyces albus]
MRTKISWPRSRAGQLSPQRRERDLRSLRNETYDVLVIGGGVTGAGAAVDAASRGLKTALVESRDFAAGTSSRSSKLIHGGLRYLEQLNFALVHEALTERGLLAESIAPHLVRPLPFLVPLNNVVQRGYYGAGVALYDLLATAKSRGRGGMPWHRHLSKRQTQEVFPHLRSDLHGSIRYFDGQVDDARFVTTLARTAASLGAAVTASVEAVGLLQTPSGRVRGIKAFDVESGEYFEIRAKSVISAAGVWSDDIAALTEQPVGIRVQASKGVHLVLPRSAIDGDMGIISKTRWSVLFIIPWGEQWIIGTTDTPWHLNRSHPAASASDVAYLLEQTNMLLNKQITIKDVAGVYAGLRPLLRGETDSTSQLSREHAVVQPAPGLVLVAGGKFTTYRVMAADAVDAAVPTAPPSGTDRLPLLGADAYHYYWQRRSKLARHYNQSVPMIEHLLQRYGCLTPQVLRLSVEQPQLARPVKGAEEYLRAEIVYAARSEGALHLEDVLTRRTRISVETPDRGIEAAADAADLMGAVLNWDEKTREREIDAYHERVAAERRSQQQPTDDAAEAARLAAVEIRRVRPLATSEAS